MEPADILDGLVPAEYGLSTQQIICKQVYLHLLAIQIATGGLPNKLTPYYEETFWLIYRGEEIDHFTDKIIREIQEHLASSSNEPSRSITPLLKNLLVLLADLGYRQDSYLVSSISEIITPYTEDIAR